MARPFKELRDKLVEKIGEERLAASERAALEAYEREQAANERRERARSEGHSAASRDRRRA